MSHSLFLEETTLFHIPSHIFLIFLSLILLLIFKRLFLSKSPPLPPGPFAWPIVGNIFQIGPNPHKTLARFSKTYGPIFSFKIGSKLVVVGSSPTAAKEILKTHDRVLSARFDICAAPGRCMKDPDLAVGWVRECDESWKNLRSFCKAELFSATVIASQATMRDQKVKEMLGFVRKMESRVLKIRDVAFVVVLNFVSNMLMSKDLGDWDDEILNDGVCGIIETLLDVSSSPNISDFCPSFGAFDLQNLQKRARQLCIEFCNVWKDVIEEKIKKLIIDRSSSTDFLDSLIKNGYSKDHFNPLVVEMFTAGTATTSSTIEWMMTELIRNPKSMKIVQDELSREIGQNQDVKQSDLPKLTYLEACVKETLRLHPTAPLLLPHRAAESCTVMNYTIPKDSLVIVNAWEIGRDPSYWEEPLSFKPERFLNTDSGLGFKGSDFKYFPFSSGRRICPGMPMAAVQVPLVVASLVHSFDWSIPEGMSIDEVDMAEKFGLATKKKVPLLLVPKPKSF